MAVCGGGADALSWRSSDGIGCCAGVSGSFKGFLEASAEDLQAVTRTNLLGALLCTRAATAAMARQPRGGHIFNMDGAGADHAATPMYAAYGATKAGIAHVMGSVAAECEAAGLPVGVHTLSPGMVLTDLILDGATNKNKQVRTVRAVRAVTLPGGCKCSTSGVRCRCSTFCVSSPRWRRRTSCRGHGRLRRGTATGRTSATSLVRPRICSMHACRAADTLGRVRGASAALVGGCEAAVGAD